MEASSLIVDGTKRTYSCTYRTLTDADGELDFVSLNLSGSFEDVERDM